MKVNVSNRTLGINFTTRGEAEVLLWAPYADQVILKIENDKKGLSLIKQDRGYWSCITDRLHPGDLYQFEINNENKFPDPASLSQPLGVHGPSQIIRLDYFHWTDSQWQNIPLEEYIFYELHTGTFSESGTFSGIEEKLNYLVDLGITAIEIMPVGQFPGDRNWGYDGVLPFAVQNSYGGAEALQHLVNACHEKGLAVVLDVVYNHIGPEGNYLGNYGPYFTDKYKTPWGEAVNFDDAWCDGVRHYFMENALMWLRDFHIDALRLDAVHAIRDFSPVHILRELKEFVAELDKETGRVHYLIAESDLNDVRYIKSIENEGYGMDAQWMDEFHHALRVTTGQSQTGYYSDFSGIIHLAKAYKDAYVYDGVYSTHRHKTFGSSASGIEGKRFVVFSQNHDQVGNRSPAERSSNLVSLEMQKVMAGAVMVSPYLPLLFMGEEYSEPRPFSYFISHTDPLLVNAVRKGRRKEFEAFHSESIVHEPDSEEIFLDSKLQWQLVNKEPHTIVLRFYQRLIHFRKVLSSLRNLNRKNLSIEIDEAKNTLTLHRWHEREHVLCLMNFSNEAQVVALPEVKLDWEKILDSASEEFGGSKSSPIELLALTSITLQPESFLLYAHGHV
jgi:maltooligosyltrehalose trehalohydrolase